MIGVNPETAKSRLAPWQSQEVLPALQGSRARVLHAASHALRSFINGQDIHKPMRAKEFWTQERLPLVELSYAGCLQSGHTFTPSRTPLTLSYLPDIETSQ
jgi:hypothetical protein